MSPERCIEVSRQGPSRSPSIPVNLEPAKGKSTERIDGIVAIVAGYRLRLS